MRDLVGTNWPIQWALPDRVGACMTTRFSGHSEGHFAGLNLADHVGDLSSHVDKNRAWLAKQLGVTPVFLRQVHGIDCLTVTAITQSGSPADASTTILAGKACTVMVADCLPVLLCDQNGTRVAAAHAGWRGLLAGVLDQTVAEFDTCQSVMAWLGPCIGPTVFEVGPEVHSAYVSAWGATAGGEPYFVGLGGGEFLCNLAELARLRLGFLGVNSIDGNDGSVGWCTVSNPERWFSHRREGTPQGGTGRMAACIWIKP